MNIFTEHHATEASLYSRVDEILENGGLYNIVRHPAGYTINYWFFEGYQTVYRVVKGKHWEGYVFYFTVGTEEADEAKMVLEKGDLLIYAYESKPAGKVWFYCPKLLIGVHEKKIKEALGFTRYGQLAGMLQNNMIERVTIMEPPVLRKLPNSCDKRFARHARRKKRVTR